MIEKFTQKQYEQIVAISEDNAEAREEKTKEIIDYIFDNKLMPAGRTEVLDRALVISNPLTREIGRGRYVEKENKYYWTTKKLDKYGAAGRLYKTTDDSIKPYFDAIINDTDEQLTESELREWGYNPDMFDKEEVI